MEKSQQPFVWTQKRKQKSKTEKRHDREQAAGNPKLPVQNLPRAPWHDTPVASWDTASNVSKWETVTTFSTSTVRPSQQVPVDTRLAQAVAREVKPISAWDKPLKLGKPTPARTKPTPALAKKQAAIPEFDYEAHSRRQWAAEQAKTTTPLKTEKQLQQEQLVKAMEGWPWKDQPEKQLTMVCFFNLFPF